MTVHEDRLAQIAVELARRVREEDADDNGDWLAAQIGADDLWALIFVQAAVGPTTTWGFRQRLAWAEPDSIDDIAVERALRGEPVQLSRIEQAAAVKRATRRGVSVRVTARLLDVDRRWISRVRAGQVKYAREVA